MAPQTLMKAVTLAMLVAAPAFAGDDQNRRGGQQSHDRSTEQRQQAAPPQRQNDRQSGRREAVPRQRQAEAPRQLNAPRQSQAQPSQAPRQSESQRREFEPSRQSQAPRGYAVPRRYEAPRQSDRRVFDNRRFDDRRFDNRGYNGRRFGSARIIRPSIIEIVPYRYYSYRPSWRVGVFYGAGGSYPYGYTPRGYYDPIPGRYYGGVRITGMPRDAQVFADGYFIGIVDDFDGIFQHMNLEAGPHHIEIQDGSYEPIAFDVNVRPSQTITFRADQYRPY